MTKGKNVTPYHIILVSLCHQINKMAVEWKEI